MRKLMYHTRRSFLKSTAIIAASIVSGNALKIFSKSPVPFTRGPGNKWPGRVIINFNKIATLGLHVNEAVVKNMIDDSILSLTHQKSIGDAWKSIFPETLTIESKIALKINILNNGKAAPDPSSVLAITQGLMQMKIHSEFFPAPNITIYDGNNWNSMESAGYTSDKFGAVKLIKDTNYQWGDGVQNRSYATTLHDCQFLINIFSPIGHSKEFGGFTLGFKNHYGSYVTSPKDQHQALLRDINCKGPVFEKTVLNVCNGIFGMNEGVGPSGGLNNYSIYSKKIDPSSTCMNPSTIIMSTDPVSCEYQAIKMMRLNNGKSFAMNDLPDYLKAASGIIGKLSPVYNIGIIDEEKMDAHRIINNRHL